MNLLYGVLALLALLSFSHFWIYKRGTNAGETKSDTKWQKAFVIYKKSLRDKLLALRDNPNAAFELLQEDSEWSDKPPTS